MVELNVEAQKLAKTMEIQALQADLAQVVFRCNMLEQQRQTIAQAIFGLQRILEYLDSLNQHKETPSG